LLFATAGSVPDDCEHRSAAVVLQLGDVRLAETLDVQDSRLDDRRETVTDGSVAKSSDKHRWLDPIRLLI